MLSWEGACIESDIASVQIDWSENARIRQSCEEKSAYYHEDLISLYTRYIWTKEKIFSQAAFIDCTDPGLAKLHAHLCLCMYRVPKNSLTYMKKHVCKLFFS